MCFISFILFCAGDTSQTPSEHEAHRIILGGSKTHRARVSVSRDLSSTLTRTMIFGQAAMEAKAKLELRKKQNAQALKLEKAQVYE